jgi:hypothetical protein
MSEDRQPLTGSELVRWWTETGERELCQLLYWKWDPIGVSDSFPWAIDEYDGYASQILSALRDPKANSVEQLLQEIEAGAMGLSGGRREHHRTVASTIAEWLKQSQARWSEFGPLRR